MKKNGTVVTSRGHYSFHKLRHHLKLLCPLLLESFYQEKMALPYLRQPEDRCSYPFWKFTKFSGINEFKKEKKFIINSLFINYLHKFSVFVWTLSVQRVKLLTKAAVDLTFYSSWWYMYFISNHVCVISGIDLILDIL